MVRCICGKRPGVYENGELWLILCDCGGGFGCGYNRKDARKMWNDGIRHKKKMKRLENRK